MKELICRKEKVVLEEIIFNFLLAVFGAIIGTILAKLLFE